MTPTTSSETEIETTETSLTLRRTFDAPRGRVWRAFTDADAMAQWYGGELMDVEIHALETEPGGSFSITMRDDETYDIEGEFLEVVEHERVVHTWYVGQVTVELTDVAGGTEIELTHDGLPDRETTDMHAQGWGDAVDSLATVLASDEPVTTDTSDAPAAGTTEAAEFDPSAYDVTITRTFDASREAVWAAWTDPEQVAQWWGPEGFTVPHCELDVRPGGSFHVDMEAPDGTVYPDAGEVLEVEAPERLVLVSRAFEDEEGTYQLETQSTVTFEADGERTQLTLDAEVLTATPEVAVHLEGMELGWTGSFEKLEAYLSEAEVGRA
ncbi:SRPBCC family protein [Natronobiforma cellulositropha]|uniref:SRPBCC family protein n=1 Tax=Natronobiforma cellulositropha TaxID=1679076 RepID=UPI0021D6034F|nr:SRPBCC family protein [Natronobiforma cellulositropha]